MSLEEKGEILIVRSAKGHYAVSPEGKTHFCLSDRWRDILECISDSKNLLADRSAKRWMYVLLLAKRHCWMSLEEKSAFMILRSAKRHDELSTE